MIASTMGTYIAVVSFLLVLHYASTSIPYDTIVVGLGSAGVTAASDLARSGKRVLALEAQDRIGGRVKTVPFGDGVVEVGGEWIQGTNNCRTYETAMKYNIGVVPQDIIQEIFMSDGSPANHTLINELVEYCMEVQDNPEKNESVGSLITRKFTEYLKEKYPHLLENKDFLNNFMDLLGLLVNNYDGSNNWYDLSAHAKFEHLEGHQHMSFHRYGYKTFFDILLNTYNNGPGWPTLDIKLNKEVTQIRWPQSSSGSVQVVCRDGDVYTANNVIVTVSLGVLKERYSSLFSPALPQEKITAIEKMSIGVVDKIILRFDEQWLPSGRFYSFLWRDAEKNEISREDFWITKIFACSTPLGSRNTLTCWSSSDIAKLVETLPEDVVREKIMVLVRKFMGKNWKVPEAIGMVRSTWYSNPFTRGSYTYDNILTYEYPNGRAILGEPLVDSSGIPKVLFAGEATNLNHYGTVHGASETGNREAKRVLSLSVSKDY